jgi:hypothetical protein
VRLIVAARCGCLEIVMHLARAAVEILRLAVARDRLGPPPEVSAEPPKKPDGVLHLLFVSREPLGSEPEAPHAPRSIFRTLFAPEQLPFDPEPPRPARGRGRLAALLAPEKLDDAP